MERPSAIVSCAWCLWRAKLTADGPLEVAATLRRLLLAHIQTQHPERVTSEAKPS